MSPSKVSAVLYQVTAGLVRLKRCSGVVYQSHSTGAIEGPCHVLDAHGVAISVIVPYSSSHHHDSKAMLAVIQVGTYFSDESRWQVTPRPSGVYIYIWSLNS